MIRFAAALFLTATVAIPAQAEVNIQSVTSPGGVEAWLVEEHSLPFVALEIAFTGGTSLDVEGKRGAINLMTALLEEGSGDLDARGFARATEALATSFRFGAGPDQLSISARFLTENFDASVALLRDVMQDPHFEDVDVERVRGQVLSGLASAKKSPDDIASKTFAAMVYGQHPYGSVEDGTVESVTALTRDDLFEAHKNVLVRDRVLIGAVGDITPEQLGNLLDALLGDLPQSGPALPPIVEPQFDGTTKVVEFETPQSVALFGQRGLAVNDDDYFAAVLMNHILGGGSFESRLMQEVREKRGLTYGVYSYLYPRDLANVFLGSVSSANDRVSEAVAVIRDQWSLMAEKGVTEEELQNAKTYLTGAYPLRFDGNGTIAGLLVGMQTIGLDVDYVKSRNKRVEQVTLEDVQRVASELLDPDTLQFVVVGKPTGLDPE